MDKPAILCVDDEPAVLSAIARDVRSQYAEKYRVVRADSGAAALEAIEQLRLRDVPIALLLCDQRMPGMTGVEFLVRARELAPDARRVLLTAYADTDAAIKAINEVQLDHYLMKPWDPPEDRLYPVLDELLDDWMAAQPADYEGIRVIGHRWSAASHDIKDFLARNILPYHWFDVETDEEAQKELKAAHLDDSRLPVVLFKDGAVLVQPTTFQVAEQAGLKTRPSARSYDLVIVGSGPAGLAAAVYGGSEGLSTLLVERDALGGQAGTSSFIENYLGFQSGISGGELMRRARIQAERFGVEILTPLEAVALRLNDPYRLIELTDGSVVSGRALVIASGVQYRRLDVPSLDRLTGAGVYYGAARTEAQNTRDQDVIVVGGGNSAGQAAMHLAGFARSVTILVRGDGLSGTMSHYLIDRINDTPNVSVWTHCQVTAVDGDDRLACVSVLSSESGETRIVPAAALFIFIGALPRTDWVGDSIERDRFGFIPTGVELLHGGRRPDRWWADRDPFWLEASAPGVFVAGDVRSNSIKRVASAVGEGSMAVSLVHQHLASL